MALNKNDIAKRIAQELRSGFYVNLGIGIPTLVANHIPKDIAIESLNIAADICIYTNHNIISETIEL